MLGNTPALTNSPDFCIFFVMATTDLMLGISLSGRSVQAVEIDRSGKPATLLAIDEWDNMLMLGEDRQGDEHIDQFSECLAAFLKVNRAKARRVAMAIDTSYLFLNTIPVERDLPHSELADQIGWELRQYFPDHAVDDFITDVHRIAASQTSLTEEALSVSVLRQHVRAVRVGIEKLGLELHLLDADHFSAHTALRVNYPDASRRHLALIGVKENRLDISVLKNGNLEEYSYRLVNSGDEIVDQIARVSRESPGIFSITVYGPHLSNDLLVRIRHGSALLVEALNPLRHVHMSDTLRLADHLSVPSYRFASAVGVALRRD
jgi:Tfp pilus assembly PilM family ATPase